MLAEERFAAILQLLQEKKTVTVNELTKTLHISESTIRRDLVSLHKMKKLRKVHGGATLLQKEYAPIENDVTQRSQEHIEEKRRLAQYAATLIEPHDFIYLDAGSTILHMAEFIEEKECNSLQEVEAYYTNMGKLLAFLHIFGAKDYHGENILVIIEGLTMYLCEKDIRKMFSIIERSFQKVTVMVETMSPFVVRHVKEKSIEGSNAKFTWGVKNGTELQKIVPNFSILHEVSLVEGMKELMSIYHVIGKIPAVRNISNKIVVLEKRS